MYASITSKGITDLKLSLALRPFVPPKRQYHSRKNLYHHYKLHEKFSYKACMLHLLTVMQLGQPKSVAKVTLAFLQCISCFMVIPMNSFCQKSISGEIDHFTCCHIHVYKMLYVDIFLTPTSLASIVFQVKIVVKSGIQLV